MLCNGPKAENVTNAKTSLLKRMCNLFRIAKPSVKIALTYFITSAIWILCSDYLLKVLKIDIFTVVGISILKGLFFVTITCIMLYLLIESSMKALLLSKEELKKNDELYRLVIDGTTDGLWDWDAETNSTYISPRWMENMGYEDVKSMDEFWNKVVHPDDSERVYDEIIEYTHKKIPKLTCEFRLKTGKGDYVWISLKGQGIWDDKGNIVRIIGTNTEITERKVIEEELKNANKENIRLLNESIENDRIKTEAFANISHEFRTPLNVLLGSVQLIESYQYNCEDNLATNTKIIRHIKVIKQNCYRLVRLGNNLIDITKIDSGFMKVEIQNCNIVQVIEEITLSVKEFIENKSLNLVFDTDIEEKVISCDVNKIERILLNLLSNAAKFNKIGGSIIVNLADMGDSVEITIRDTGIGIPDDKVGLIFDRFRQVNSSLTREHEGSGIGLSIVKSLVEMQGGTILLKSKVGKGTEFKIKLPANSNTFEDEVLVGYDKANRYIHMARVEFSDIYSV